MGVRAMVAGRVDDGDVADGVPAEPEALAKEESQWDGGGHLQGLAACDFMKHLPCTAPP